MLFLLIVLQSMVAIANADQFHQTDKQLLEVNHSHYLLSLNEKQKIIKDSASDGEYDCNHCCHCHGMDYSFLLNPYNNVNFSLPVLVIFEYNLKYFSLHIPPNFRPPIA